MSSFKDLRIVDNFYQTSAFFPMPTVLVGTLAEDGSTSLGPYSLVQPYYIAGKDYYAMLLLCRNSSNTAQHILARGKCSLNFITDDKKLFKEAVRLDPAMLIGLKAMATIPGWACSEIYKQKIW
jgi:flavin reductase (DIM6/NTAB) family NADH-FMN oxidoreductase RutF